MKYSAVFVTTAVAASLLSEGVTLSASRAQNTSPATRSPTPWSSKTQSLYPKWMVGRTYHFTTRIEPSLIEPMTTLAPAPPVTAVVASGNCTVSHFSAAPWKLGKSKVLTIRYDYTPLAEATGNGHVIHLLTKDKRLAATIKHVSGSAN